jgi:hypothetical protein
MHARRLRAGLAATLAVCACRGPDEIPLGGKVAPATEHFLSPTGADGDGRGTRDRPWKTFRYALQRLAPGSTLTLLTSVAPYDDATTGTLNVKCADMVIPNSAAPNAVPSLNGTLGMEITVRADEERQAFLQGNGSVPPISIDSCQYWKIVGLHVESRDVPDNLSVPDTGSVVVLDGANNNITLTRLLASHPNRYKRSNVIRIGDNSIGITVEECELYDFHHNAFEAWRTSSILLHRNYINSRDAADIPGGYVTEDATRGDYGVFLEETNGVYAENNVVEDVSIGFGVMGRDMAVNAPAKADPLDNNQLLGNIVLKPSVMGFRLDSRCQFAGSCDASHKVLNTDLGNDVVIGGTIGVWDAGSVNTRIHELSIIDTARGVALIREPQNIGLQATATAVNTLVAGFQSVAFAAMDQMQWGFDHCDAAGGYAAAANYVPDDPQHVTSKVDVMPNLGGCMVYLPAGSPLIGAGAANSVGANILYRYDHGTLSSSELLWNATTGAFPCGATAQNVNSDPLTGCMGLNLPKRLNVDTSGIGGCPLP